MTNRRPFSGEPSSSAGKIARGWETHSFCDAVCKLRPIGFGALPINDACRYIIHFLMGKAHPYRSLCPCLRACNDLRSLSSGENFWSARAAITFPFRNWIQCDAMRERLGSIFCLFLAILRVCEISHHQNISNICMIALSWTKNGVDHNSTEKLIFFVHTLWKNFKCTRFYIYFCVHCLKMCIFAKWYEV